MPSPDMSLVGLVRGRVLAPLGAMLLTLPEVLPVLAKSYGNLFGFGGYLVKMVEICLITPPIGLNCFVVAGVRPDIPLGSIFKGIWWFFVCDVLTVALFVAFPNIVLWLPNAMLGR